MTPPVGPFPHHRADPPLLVGREQEQRLLGEHLAAALGGQGHLVLVGGEAGIGKTALVAVAAREAAAHGALVLGGGCYDLTATPPYGPWRELAAGYRPAAGLPPLPGVLAAGDGVEEVGGQGALFAQVRAFLAAVAAARPLAVVLEDLHWADPASLDLLRFVARQLASVPLLLVATYRADELTRRHPLYQLLPVLVREARAERLDLRRLDEAAVRRLVAADYSLPDPAAGRLVDHLQAHAEGNPFYVHELLRSLEEEGTLRPDGDGWALGDLARARVPQLLRQVIDGRVARLGEEARDALAVAAVIGQEVPLGVWSAVAERAEEELLAVVERAVEAHLLDATGDGASVRFGHALIREALYEGVLPPRRRVWHRRVAEALTDLPAADPDAMAHHFGQAGDARATEWLLRAGERAQRAFAWRTAVERFGAVVSALEGDPARAGERGWLLYRISRLLRYVDAARAHTYLEEAERVAAAVADPVLAAYALVDGGMLRCIQGNIRRGLAEMEDGVEALDALPAERTTADATIAAWVADSLPAAARGDSPAPPSGVNPRRGALVLWRVNVGRFAEARTMAETYLDQIAAVGRLNDLDLGSVGDAHLGLGWVYAVLGQPDAARERFASARAAHRATGHHGMLTIGAGLELAVVVLPYRTTDLAERRRLKADVEAAWARAGEALAVGGLPHLAGFGQLTELLLLEGNWVDARELDRAASFDNAWRWSLAAGLGVMARYQGHSELAWELVREVLPEGPTMEPGGSMFHPAVGLQRVAAELALDAGDLRLARAWIEAHDRWLTWSGSVLGQAEGRLLWARFHRLAGEAGLAREHAKAALARADAPSQPLARLAAHRLLGELATEAGQLADAERHLGESLALADACAAPFERALTLLRLAELRAASGKAGEASALLVEVRAICTPLGAAPTLARAEALVAKIETGPVGVADHRPGLSAREVEVLRLVAEGLTDAEVAERLSISPRTVGQHLRSIYNKLDVSSRTAATRVAVERRLL